MVGVIQSRMQKILVVLICFIITACGGGGGSTVSTPPTPPISAIHTVMSPGNNFNGIPNITAADLNGDGLEDVVVSGWNPNVLTAYLFIFIQNSDGTLTDKTSELLANNVIEGSQRIEVADFDNDGHVDIFIPGFGDDAGTHLPGVTYTAHSIMFWGTSSQYVRDVWTDRNWAHGACIGDLNNDGKIDILAAGAGYSGGDVGGIYMNNGNRTFTLQPTTVLTDNGFASCAVIKEGTDSLIYLSNNKYIAGQLRSQIIKMDASLAITAQTWLPYDSYDPIDVIATDMNGDGKKDLIVIKNDSAVTLPGPTLIYTNNGDSTFTVTSTLPLTRSAFYGRALTIDGTPSFFISGDRDNAMVYKGTTRYKSTAFTDMSAGSINAGVVALYQNATLGKTYILQMIDNVFKTREL